MATAGAKEMSIWSKHWRVVKEKLAGKNARRAKALARYAKWDAMLQQEEQSFNLRKNGLDVFDFPLHTGIQMDVDNFWWWYGSQDRNLMLAFLDGEVRIVGERYSPAHVLAVGAFEQLVESIDKVAILPRSPLYELDGRLWMGKIAYVEASTACYHQDWKPDDHNNPPIVLHAFDRCASSKYMKTFLNWVMKVPGVHLCIGFKLGSSPSSPCIALAMWKDPVATEGVTEACCDGSTETLCIPLKACFEGEEHVPSMLRAHVEEKVTINLSRLRSRYQRHCDLHGLKSSS